LNTCNFIEELLSHKCNRKKIIYTNLACELGLLMSVGVMSVLSFSEEKTKTITIAHAFVWIEKGNHDSGFS